MTINLTPYFLYSHIGLINGPGHLNGYHFTMIILALNNSPRIGKELMKYVELSGKCIESRHESVRGRLRDPRGEGNSYISQIHIFDILFKCVI